MSAGLKRTLKKITDERDKHCPPLGGIGTARQASTVAEHEHERLLKLGQRIQPHIPLGAARFQSYGAFRLRVLTSASRLSAEARASQRSEEDASRAELTHAFTEIELQLNSRIWPTGGRALAREARRILEVGRMSVARNDATKARAVLEAAVEKVGVLTSLHGDGVGENSTSHHLSVHDINGRQRNAAMNINADLSAAGIGFDAQLMAGSSNACVDEAALRYQTWANASARMHQRMKQSPAIADDLSSKQRFIIRSYF